MQLWYNSLVVGSYDLRFHHHIGQGFPEIPDGHNIAFCQIRHIPEMRCSIPSSVTGDNAVGVLAANGQAGKGHMGCTMGKMCVSSSQIDRHFQIDLSGSKDCEHFILQAIVQKVETGLFIVIRAVEAGLHFGIEGFIVSTHLIP